jgi:hypothetical protein
LRFATLTSPTTAAVDAVLLVVCHLFLLLPRPEWPHGKKTDGCRDLFPSNRLPGWVRSRTEDAHAPAKARC